MLVVVPLTAPPSAAAEPRSEIWKCWHARLNDQTIPRTQYWSCPDGTLRIIDSYTGSVIRKLDGRCANTLWTRTNRTATYRDAVRRCTQWVA